MNPNYTTSSVNSPDPVAARALMDLIERTAKECGEAAARARIRKTAARKFNRRKKTSRK